MTDHFAWSALTVKDPIKEGTFLRIPVGEKVNKTQIGQDWDDFLAAGVIRTTPFPKDVRSDESPRTAILRHLNEEQKKLEEPFQHELEDDGDTS